MNINAQQYNAVVEGLKTQLELQRQLTREKINIIASLTEQCNTLRQLRDLDQEVLHGNREQINGLVTKTVELVAVACGDDLGLLDTDPQVMAVRAVRSATQDRIAELEDTIARCKVRRGKKCCTKGCC